MTENLPPELQIDIFISMKKSTTHTFFRYNDKDGKGPGTGALRVAALALLAIGVTSCGSPERVPEEFFPNNSHDEYLYALEQLGLLESSMGRLWESAGNPRENPRSLSLTPFEEIRVFSAEQPDAAWYLIEGIRGQEISIEIESQSTAGYFADVLAIEGDWDPRDSQDGEWRQLRFTTVASAKTMSRLEDMGTAGGDGQSSGAGIPDVSPQSVGSARALQGSGVMSFEPRQQRFYLLRIQPRLLEGGRFVIRVSADASLSWPVRDSGPEDVISVFGADRDGGRRVHHGIDIIAPRGTDILSVSPSLVRRVGERERGGRTVSLSDEWRGLMIYYAHMESYGELREGQRIDDRVVLGTVEDSGNALGGPPHLHIGIYDRSWRRPLDPWYFFIPVPVSDVPPAANEVAGFEFGSQLRSSQVTTLFRRLPGSNPTLSSPSIIGYDGERIPAEAKPVLEQGWGEEIVFPAGSIIGRLVATRSQAAGLLDDERRLLWIPIDQLPALELADERTEA